MEPALKIYVHLTEIDASIAATGEQLAAYPGMLAAMETAEGRQTAIIADARQRAAAAAHDRRAAEKAVLELREQIHKYTLHQVAVKTNKEYEALTSEIEQIRQRIDKHETLGLERLAVEEECGATLAAAETALARLRERHAAERRRIEGQVAEKRERLERLRAERARAVVDLDPDAAENYETANERHPGGACAAMDGDHCAGCGWQGTPRVRQAVAAGQLIRCEHCRRFLYAKS
jgi:predicted  nucleic acid-binding Zn-ribbon protein